jgi:hypothetical protein
VILHRSIAGVIAFGVAALLFTTAGCGSSDDELTGPSSTSVTVPFGPDILTLNGARTYSFTVTATGGISAQLISWEPNATLPVGMSLGTWNGSICQVVLSNDQSVQGSLVVGQTNTPGDYCVRIYDADGKIVEPQTYVIHVTHQQAANQ